MSLRTLVDLYGKLAKGFKYIVYFDENNYLYIADLTCIFTYEHHEDYVPDTKCDPKVIFTTNPEYVTSSARPIFTYEKLCDIIRDNYSDSIDQNGVVNLTEKTATSLLKLIGINVVAKAGDIKSIYTRELSMNDLNDNDVDENLLYCFAYPNTNRVAYITYSTAKLIRYVLLGIYNRDK